MPLPRPRLPRSILSPSLPLPRPPLPHSIFSPSLHRRSAMPPALEKRAVAGSFIFKFAPDGRPQVALFRRSAAVRTYPHKYAPISGSVEPGDASPLAAAWRELAEETALAPPQLRLLRQGPPYAFADAAVGREWAIHPFAFALAGPEAAIRLDWEHDGFAWFDPAAVSDDAAFGGVPRLRESLRRVWFELDLGPRTAAVLDAGLRRLRDDHASGARELAGVALAVLADVAPALDPGAGAGRWWRNLRVAAWHLWKNGRETMGAPVLHAVLASLAAVEGSVPAGDAALAPGFADAAAAAVRAVAKQREAAGSQIEDAFCAFLERQQHLASSADPIPVLTLSASSTVTACLGRALARGIPLHTRVLESRPLFEGVATARRLVAAAPGARVSVHTDASAALAADGARLVLVGADLIDRRGAVSNKTGSLPAVLAARHVSPGVAVVVLTGRDKVLPYPPPGPEHNDPAEVTRAWGDGRADGLDVDNVYFEWVPPALVDHYITEDGVMTAEAIVACANDVEQRADRFFSDL